MTGKKMGPRTAIPRGTSQRKREMVVTKKVKEMCSRVELQRQVDKVKEGLLVQVL